MTAPIAVDPNAVHQQLIEATQENLHLRERIRVLEQETRTDSLTGLPNRRAGQEAMDAARARCARHGIHWSCLLMDLDHFKEVNDLGGHDNGDRVLTELPSVFLVAGVRRTDVLCRWGGEEFLLVTETSCHGTRQLAERIRRLTPQMISRMPQGTAGQTLSIGIACTSCPEVPGEALLKAADRALYRAKSIGRNSVVVASEAELIDCLDFETQMRVIGGRH